MNAEKAGYQDRFRAAMKADLRAELAAFEARLSWRMVVALAAQGALVIAALKLIP